MDKLLDEAASREIAEQIKSKAKKPFDNAYKAVLATEGAVYAQGFLVPNVSLTNFSNILG